MKQSITLKSAGPFLLLTFIYFIVGFLTTVNGQCQGPLQVAFLSKVTATKNFLHLSRPPSLHHEEAPCRVSGLPRYRH
jgi:hypothetical protein